jgi:hypothetical protein
MEWLIANRPDFFEQVFLLVPAQEEVPPPTADQRRHLAEFNESICRIFFVILDYRGKGLDRRAGFRSDQAATAYHVLLRRHRARVAESGPLLAESARLPAALCWALDLLTAQCRAAEDPVANELWALCAASAAAAQLHRAAADRLLGSRADALLERRLHIVRKLVDRLGEIGPAKRRELLRGLAQQSLAVNGPLIDALILTVTDNGAGSRSCIRKCQGGRSFPHRRQP